MAGIYPTHRLVGKFFTGSTPPTLEETEESLRKQWAITGSDLTIEEQDDDTFLFKFSQCEQKDKAKGKGPFCVNGVILVLKDPDCDEMDFTKTMFCIAVVGLPFYLFNKEYLPTLQSEVSEYNPYVLKTPAGPNDHVLFGVKVDLKKPLRAGYYLRENKFVEFKYFDLGDFCYNCGMIGHVKEDCDKVPMERALNATDTTPVYGPWLRFKLLSGSFETVLTKSETGTVGETPLDAQFVIEVESNCIQVCEPRIKSTTVSTHTFRLPCSYLDGENDSSSKAYKAIQREINESKPCCFNEMEEKDKPDIVGDVVETLKLIEKNSDDKLVSLKLQINHIFKFSPVEYETMLADEEERRCESLIESKILDLIKTRVMENDVNLSILSSWETQIRKVLTEVGLAHFMEFLEVPRRASEAMAKAHEAKVVKERIEALCGQLTSSYRSG